MTRGGKADEPSFLVRERFGVGESPVWDGAQGRLLWCDIPAGVIHAMDVDSGARQSWQFGEPVPSLGLAQNGRLVVALRDAVVLFDPETGQRETIARVEHAKAGMRLNDGKVGPDGAFWVGSMDGSGDGTPAARLYRVAPNGDLRVVAEGIAISNGLAWNAAADRMYHSDSRGDVWLDCWNFDASTGTVSNRRRLREHDEAAGRPDGGACDMAGNYWSAGPSAGRLNRFSADGELLDWIELPIATPTMPCFGDDDMRTIYITSLDSKAGDGRDGVVRLRVEVPGVAVSRFGG